jgi:glycosyltransferase involved in cell wall biosynthesis
MAEAVGREVPGTAVVQVPVPTRPVRVEREEVVALRRRLGFGDDDFVIGTFGLLTAEKQVETVARAVARVAADVPGVRLLLAGPVPEGAALDETLARAGMASRAVVTGRLPLDEIPAHIEAADAVVQLRYPTARETSAALLRVLGQGRPTVISDLAHQAEIPGDAVVRADVADEEGAAARALLDLVRDPERATRLGTAAAAWVARKHSPAAAQTAWADALERIRREPPPEPRTDWPAHWPRPRAGAG